MAKKYTIEEVRGIIEKEGCKLLSEVYEGNKKPLLIQCYCGEEFITTLTNFNKGKKQCDKCTWLKDGRRVIFNCDYCGKECSKSKSDFEGREHHFCSKECKDKWQKENLLGENNPNYGNHGKLNGEKSPVWKDVEKVPCDYCGNPIRLIGGKLYYGHHFCNKECYDKWQKINALRGENSPHFGKHLNEETKLKISEANKGRFIGEKSPCYNPNITDEERERRRNGEQKQWREDVYERDNYTCQCCGDNKGGNLNAHHLNGHHWDKEHRTDVDNGICLCSKCHKEYHKLYGNRNNTIAQFREFLFNKYLQNNNLKFLALIENIDLTTRAF